MCPRQAGIQTFLEPCAFIHQNQGKYEIVLEGGIELKQIQCLQDVISL